MSKTWRQRLAAQGHLHGTLSTPQRFPDGRGQAALVARRDEPARLARFHKIRQPPHIRCDRRHRQQQRLGGATDVLGVGWVANNVEVSVQIGDVAAHAKEDDTVAAAALGVCPHAPLVLIRLIPSAAGHHAIKRWVVLEAQGHRVDQVLVPLEARVWPRKRSGAYM